MSAKKTLTSIKTKDRAKLRARLKAKRDMFRARRAEKEERRRERRGSGMMITSLTISGSWLAFLIYGGKGPNGFDCSGLVIEILKARGICKSNYDATAHELFIRTMTGGTNKTC